jgi:hypothetical protein
VFLVSGEGKSGILRDVLKLSRSMSYPARLVQPMSDTKPPQTTITKQGCCGLLTGVELADCPCFSAFCPCLITAWFLWASSTSCWLALLGIRGASAELCAHSSKSKRSAESRKNYKALARWMTLKPMIISGNGESIFETVNDGDRVIPMNRFLTPYGMKSTPEMLFSTRLSAIC